MPFDVQFVVVLLTRVEEWKYVHWWQQFPLLGDDRASRFPALDPLELHNRCSPFWAQASR
jgi:hypothetical protein